MMLERFWGCFDLLHPSHTIKLRFVPGTWETVQMTRNRVYDDSSAVPVNQNARRDLRGGGTHYQPDIQLHQFHWKAPPRTNPIPHRTPNLTGTQFGRFKVIGWYAKKSGWIVRCACGDYEIRKTKTIQNSKNPDACCGYCNHLLVIQRRAREKSVFKKL